VYVSANAAEELVGVSVMKLETLGPKEIRVPGEACKDSLGGSDVGLGQIKT